MLAGGTVKDHGVGGGDLDAEDLLLFGVSFTLAPNNPVCLGKDTPRALTVSPRSVSGCAVMFPEKNPFSIGSHPASNVPWATEWFEAMKPVGAKWNSRVSPTFAVNVFGLKTKVSGSVRSWMARTWIVACPRACAANVTKTSIDAKDIMLAIVTEKQRY